MGEDRPSWSDEEANALLGRRALVGITYVNADNEVSSRIEIHSRIGQVEEKRGFRLDCEGHSSGREFWLPPQPSNFHKASPGEYRLRSTGEVVINPDVIAQWSVVEPPQA